MTAPSACACSRPKRQPTTRAWRVSSKARRRWCCCVTERCSRSTPPARRGRAASIVLTEAPDGETLAARGSLPLEDIVDIGVPLADALGAAHAANLVHGALSPTRVLLTDGGPKLDFSLAPLLREEGADAAGDIRTLAAMLQAHVAVGEERELVRLLACAGRSPACPTRGRCATAWSRCAAAGRRTPACRERARPAARRSARLRGATRTKAASRRVEDPDLTGQMLGNYEVDEDHRGRRDGPRLPRPPHAHRPAGGHQGAQGRARAQPRAGAALHSGSDGGERDQERAHRRGLRLRRRPAARRHARASTA